MNKILRKELSVFNETILDSLVNIYQMMDWGCNWIDFLNEFKDNLQMDIENWKLEEIDEEI